MAKKDATSKKPPSTGGTSGPRERLETPTGKFFARRDDQGRFSEMTDVGRSLAAERRRHSETKKPRNQGDKGD